MWASMSLRWEVEIQLKICQYVVLNAHKWFRMTEKNLNEKNEISVNFLKIIKEQLFKKKQKYRETVNT